MTHPTHKVCTLHPGEILREHYLAPIDLSAHALALVLAVPATRIHEIANERRSITADTAARLARQFGGGADEAQGAISEAHCAIGIAFRLLLVKGCRFKWRCSLTPFPTQRTPAGAGVL